METVERVANLLRGWCSVQVLVDLFAPLALWTEYIRRCPHTNLQTPEIPDVLLLDFLNSRGGFGDVTCFELEPTLICEMKQTDKAEARADLAKLIFRI